MINRSLIRIKTIQILYSYLLSRNDFKLETIPDPMTSSRDRRYAYSVYLNLLFLLVKLSGVSLNRGVAGGVMPDVDNKVKNNKIGRSLADHPAIKVLAKQNEKELTRFDSIVSELSDAIKISSVLADYKKVKAPELSDDVAFWSTVFGSIIQKNEKVEKIFRKDEDFSHVGFEHAFAMLDGTLKSFEMSRSTYLNSRKALAESLDRAYDLYHALLLLPVRITEFQARRLDNAKHKYLPSAEDLNPDTHFIDNIFVKRLTEDEDFMKYFEENPTADPANWNGSDKLLSDLTDLVVESDLYKQYMTQRQVDYENDCRFWRDVMRSVVIPSDELTDVLEGNSVYWNDDLMIIGTFALKTIKKASLDPVGKLPILPKFMDDDDARFGGEIFEYVVRNRELYRSYIERFIDTKQWDADRLAFMDMVLMMAAIAELTEYPQIPVAVTLNEYIEIANDYSTRRSGQFINGVLYSVIRTLAEEGKLGKPYIMSERKSAPVQASASGETPKA